MQAIDIRRANKDLYEEVRHFYHSLVDSLTPERRYVGWKKDILQMYYEDTGWTTLKLYEYML